MSEIIPFDIQVEIMKILPAKSLLRFRSVSKAWKSVIDSSDFIAGYRSQEQHLFVRYEDSVDYKQKYVSIVDDHTFPQQKVPLTLPQRLIDYNTIGCSYGLVCLYRDRHSSRTCEAVLWNPSIRKVVSVVLPNVSDGIYRPVVGFGVCGKTMDPKIVKINKLSDDIEVFTLSKGGWRSPCGTNVPCKSIRFYGLQIVIDGYLYWLASDEITTMDGNNIRSYNLIISFDITSEEFRQVNLPDTLAYHRSHYNLSMSNLRESLVVLEWQVEVKNLLVFGVWMMKYGSFTNLYTIIGNTPDVISLRGFRKTGEPIIEIIDVRHGFIGGLAVYRGFIGVNGANRSFSVYSYMETLLLLDQPDHHHL